MGRPRGFDEADVTRAAAALFASRAYDGISVDHLVAHLGVHRNSLYKTFGSKRGLYIAALRWHVEHHVRPLIARVGAAADLAEAVRRTLAAHTAGELDLLLLAAIERSSDPEVAREVARALDALDRAVARVDGFGAARAGGRSGPPALAVAFTAALLGLRLRARVGATTTTTRAGVALARRLDRQQS